MSERRFDQLVEAELGPLLLRHGFRLLEREPSRVVFCSDRLRLAAVADRGEVGITVARLGKEKSGVWNFNGMVGKASQQRLLVLAAEQLGAERRVLQGDDAFYDALEVDQAADAAAWTAFYSGRGPRPRPGQLP